MHHTKKNKPLKTPVIVTANQLLAGLTVYLKPDGKWSDDIGQSAIAHNLEQEAALLNIAEVTANSQYVVGAYSFPVKVINQQATPISTREKIRAQRIPTITPVGLTKKQHWQNQFTEYNENNNV